MKAKGWRRFKRQQSFLVLSALALSRSEKVFNQNASLCSANHSGLFPCSVAQVQWARSSAKKKIRNGTKTAERKGKVYTVRRKRSQERVRKRFTYVPRVRVRFSTHVFYASEWKLCESAFHHRSLGNVRNLWKHFPRVGNVNTYISNESRKSKAYEIAAFSTEVHVKMNESCVCVLSHIKTNTNQWNMCGGKKSHEE